jgi:hypothetical protein
MQARAEQFYLSVVTGSNTARMRAAHGFGTSIFTGAGGCAGRLAP